MSVKSIFNIVRRLVVLELLVVLVMGCSGDSNDESSNPQLPNGFTVGHGFFEYSDYAPFDDKVLKVHYYIPENTNTNTPILFVFHGAGRNASDYRDALISKSNEYNFIVMAPEFSVLDFPGGDSYNLGNVFIDGDSPSISSLNLEEEWTFSVIEPLFDYIKTALANLNTTYYIIGHSAGGQFAHRFVMFKPNARVETIVTSASGWYTVTDLNIRFPYGFDDSPLNNSSFSSLFQKQLIVQVGELDNDPNALGLRHNQFADAQGLNRWERAQYFFNTASQLANNNNLSFNWTLIINEGADHDFELACRKGADVIFN